MAKKPSNGISKLAKVMDSRMRQQTDAPLSLDFGTIKKNGSLITNTFPKIIAKGDYMVLEGFEQEDDTRVLVAWVEDDAVVIGKLVDS